MAGEASSPFRAIRNPPPGVITDVVRPYVEGDDWDRPHRLLTVCWDGERAWADQEFMAPLTMNPDRFKQFIERRTRSAFERHKAAVEAGADPALYAAALVSEGHVVEAPGPGAAEWERARMRRDQRDRRFHEREDAVEYRTGWVADIDMRVHRLQVRADRPQDPMECETHDLNGAPFSGPLVLSVVAAALMFADLLHGDSLSAALDAPGGVAEFRRPGRGGGC